MSGIRRVGPRDLDRVVGLWAALMEHHQGIDPQWQAAPGAEDEWRRFLTGLLSDADAAVLVWDEGGDLLGFCVAQIAHAPPVVVERMRAEIGDIFVREDARRRGIGRRLVEAVTDWIEQRGVRRVEVRVAARNAEGQAFWRALGYEDLVYVLQRRV